MSVATTVYMCHEDNKKDGFILCTDPCDDDAACAWTPALVPFGGSAPSVVNPDKAILGGKGYGLQEMAGIDGLDVPPGFTLTTPLCGVFDQKTDLPAELWSKVEEAIRRVEQDMGRPFGGGSTANTQQQQQQQPLLFSCRSGAKISMPGMMDTVLNVGLNNQTVEHLALATKNRRFAYDAYRRLLDMFGDVSEHVQTAQFIWILALLHVVFLLINNPFRLYVYRSS